VLTDAADRRAEDARAGWGKQRLTQEP
jgi:hypothetical protein